MTFRNSIKVHNLTVIYYFIFDLIQMFDIVNYDILLQKIWMHIIRNLVLYDLLATYLIDTTEPLISLKASRVARLLITFPLGRKCLWRPVMFYSWTNLVYDSYLCMYLFSRAKYISLPMM